MPPISRRLPCALPAVAMVFAAAVPLLVSCRPSRGAAPAPAASPGTPRSSAPLGKNFDARIGERVDIAGESLAVTFEKVVEDSRCPTGTTCIWEGDAVVRLGLRGARAATGTLDLHAQMPSQREGAFQNYRVRIVQLVPWPKDGTGIPASQYVATLVVVRSE